jgi:uncharacterized protein (TIGR02722 family)
MKQNYYNKISSLTAITLCILAFTSCVKTVSRVQIDQVIDISGRWNDTDSRLVAEAMIEDFFNARWLQEFMQMANDELREKQTKHHAAEDDDSVIVPKHKARKPTIVIGDIKNKSFEHIEADTFIKDIEKQIVNRGSVRLIANSTFREKLRDERSSQSGNTTTETQKKFGRELGADYMMFGTINTIVDASEDDRVIFYQINLELVDLETGEVVWIGEKKIKKYRSKSGKVRSHQVGTLPIN